MSAPDVQSLKKALVEAGVEIYRAESHEIHIAERVRLHIMDSGVRVGIAEKPIVRFTIRSQRSDFPNTEPEALFDRVRASIGAQAGERGYIEESAATVSVNDPVDNARVLDVWHEITYSKPTIGIEEVISEVRWALGVDKYVGR
ncbi:MAG: hypothetical protein H5U40_13215 [Polyangiaceae bacterium]|nr:hypothetical protein [Polyangiaceae bacterium]